MVTTGQQPGLFGGPAYTITKALSALALADELANGCGVPVAPVFWAATDDADWHEAAVMHVVGAEGLDRLSLAARPPTACPWPTCRSDRWRRSASSLRAAAARSADPRVLELVDSAYPERRHGGLAYVSWLRAMLEPLGISVLDASDPALRTAADRFLRGALRAAAVIEQALLARDGKRSGAGYGAQVDRVDGLSLVFESATACAPACPWRAAARGGTHAPVGSLGGNVLLRPVLERALLAQRSRTWPVPGRSPTSRR